MTAAHTRTARPPRRAPEAQAAQVGGASSQQPVGTSAERILRLLTEHSGDVICEAREGLITYISPNTQLLTGIADTEFVGRPFRDIVHPDDLARHAHYMVPGWTGPIEACFRVAGASGEWEWREARGVRVLDDDGAHRSVFVLRDANERMESEDALRRSEGRSRALLTAIPDLMFRMTRDGTYLDFKAERAEDLYVPPETIIGANIKALLPADLADRALIQIERALDEGGVQTLEYSLPKQTGLRSYEARITASGDDEVVVISQDVTERKQAERARDESERKFRQIIEEARDVVYMHDLAGNLTEVNRAGLELFGYTAEETRSLNFAKILDPGYLHIAIDNMQRALRGEEMLKDLEFLAYAKDGSPRWLEISPSPIHRDGEVVGFQGIARDITQRRLADERARFQAQLLDMVSQAVSVISFDGDVTFWNRYAEELYGWSPDEILNHKALGFGVPENRDAAIEAMRRVASGENWTGEFLVRNRAGRIFPALVLAAPIYDSAGAIAGGVCVSTDISELKRVERDTREAEERAAIRRERTRIARELHDTVAQYFFGIGIVTKDLADHPSTSEKAVLRKLANIRRMATDGGREVRNAVSALSASGLGESLDASIERLTHEMSRSYGIAVNYERDSSEIRFSPEMQHQLYRAAKETLFNACKHAQAGTISVQLRASQESVTLTVSDDGVGLVSSVERAMLTSSGFGLPNLRDQLERSGGHLDVLDNDGRGLSILCTLPMEGAA